jgi:hypothetical protein
MAKRGDNEYSLRCKIKLPRPQLRPPVSGKHTGLFPRVDIQKLFIIAAKGAKKLNGLAPTFR